MEKSQLVSRGTCVTLVGTPENVENIENAENGENGENDENGENGENGLPSIREESYSDSSYPRELFEDQKRRRSSMYLKENLPSRTKEEPYGWIIVMAVFAIHIIVDGITNSFGTVNSELLHYYDCSESAVTSALSMLIGVTYGCGPLATLLSNRMGLRNLALLGALLACAGCLLSLLTTSIYQLWFTYGALTGLGFGFMYLPAMVTVASWFEERRAIAVSVAVCGSGVGTMSFNPLTTFLLTEYGLKGWMIIMAGISIQGAVFAALLRVPPRHCSSVEESPFPLMGRRGRRQTAVVIRLRRWIKNEVDWRLMTNWTFVFYSFSSFLGGVSCYIPYVFVFDRAVEKSGILKNKASLLFLIMGLCNIGGRLSSGFLSQRKVADNAVLYGMSCIVSGVATSFSMWCNEYFEHALYAAVFGYTGGVIVALQSVVLTDIVGVERISNAFGLLLFIQGASVFVGPPFAGYLVETSPVEIKYDVCFVVTGIIMCLSGLILLTIPLINYFKRHKKRAFEKEEEEGHLEDFSVIKTTSTNSKN